VGDGKRGRGGSSCADGEGFWVFPNPLTPTYQKAWDDSQWSFRADNTYLRLAKPLRQEREPYDLMMVYFGGTDVVGHRFWRESYPEGYAFAPGPDQVETFGELIAEYHRHTDAALGELLALVDDDWTIVVVSDHGMGPVNKDTDFATTPSPSGHHSRAPPGVFVAAGPSIKQMGMPSKRVRLNEILLGV
jgi:hypothetical protein